MWSQRLSLRFLDCVLIGSSLFLLAGGVTGCPVSTDPASLDDPAGEAENADTGLDGEADLSLDATTGIAYCQDVEAWEAARVQFEAEVIDLVNARRAEGATCGTETFGPAGPLTLNAHLRCAARVHALDMATRGYFSHNSPDGVGPGDRIDAAEYEWWTWAENIALGQLTPESVMDSWMNSPGHCSNIMNPDFTEIGVGYHDGGQWVQVFGAPADSF